LAWIALISILGGALVLGRLHPPSPAPAAIFTFRLDWTPPRPSSPPASLDEPTADPPASALEMPANPAMYVDAAIRPSETSDRAIPSAALEANGQAPQFPADAVAASEPPIAADRTPPQMLPTAAPSSPPRLQNFRPFDAKERRPRIAVVMVDLGVKPAASEAAIRRLPGEVTLAISAYADDGPRFVREAREAGHEVLLSVAMEPESFPTPEPGPETLRVAVSPQENLKRLAAALDRSAGYVGVTYVMGGRFTADREALQPVLSALRDRSLLFFESRANPRSIAHELAREIGLPRAIADRTIDAEPTRSAIDARLGEIEAIARDAGLAVAVARPYPVTFERLSAWLPTLARKGFALAPVSAARPRTPPGQPAMQPESAR
jgi:polysaccharide deacetylase 2 family uncharacterized protein YibQ